MKRTPASQPRFDERRNATMVDHIRRILRTDDIGNQVYLDAIDRGDLSPRSPRGRAALLLDRYAKRLGVG